MQNRSLTQLHDWVGASAFPCAGAKAALSRGQIHTLNSGSIASPDDDARICAALSAFAAAAADTMYTSFVVVFSDQEPMDETAFEKHLWARLQGIHNHDSAPWDPRVSSDPAALDFSYSVGGQGFYVIGLHPGASRPARRFNRAAIVFNLHQQFETLRQDGQYERMRDVIRERDAAFSGSTNPMLADFGAVSEARQYSGRVTPDAWRCPFHAALKS